MDAIRTVLERGLAAALALAMSCACTPAPQARLVNGQEPGFQAVIVRADTGEPAVIAALLIDAGADPRGGHGDGFVFAVWEDGTTVWSTSPGRHGPPLLRAVQEPQVIAHELAGMVAAIEAVPVGEREPSSPDGMLVSLIVRNGEEWLELQTDAFADVAVSLLGSSDAARESVASRTFDEVSADLPSRFVEAWLDGRDRIRSLSGTPGEPCDRDSYALRWLREL